MNSLGVHGSESGAQRDEGLGVLLTPSKLVKAFQKPSSTRCYLHWPMAMAQSEPPAC